MRRLLLVALALALSACAAHRQSSSTPKPPDPVLVAMHTTAGNIVLELDPAHAPITTANFLDHAARGDYDGTIFHRVIPTFVIQGGGFTPDLKERAKIDEASGHKDTPIKNEWQNGLKNVRGTIAMARDSDPDTATREFYINVADNPKLDTARPKAGNAGYAVFGRVIDGLMVVDFIRYGETTDRPDIIVDGEGMKNVPVHPVVITKVERLNAPAAPRSPSAADIPPPPPPTMRGQGAYRP